MKRTVRPGPKYASRARRLTLTTCELCTQTGGAELWRDQHCRVVLVEEPDYPGYCRVIWNTHIREMTDLSSAAQQHCMRVVFAVEMALKNVLKPHKINLASLGNMTPHMHWHVIPRFEHDAHFPNPVWGERRRASVLKPASRLRARLAAELSKSMAKNHPA